MRKLTLTVHVLDVPTPPGQDFNVSTYPNDGLFLTTTGMLYVKAGPLVTFIGSAPAALVTELMLSAGREVDAVLVSTPAPGSISEMTLLKAIALAQKPELALELCK